MAKYNLTKLIGEYYPIANSHQLLCRNKDECRCQDSGKCTACLNIAAVFKIAQHLTDHNMIALEESDGRVICQCSECNAQHTWSKTKIKEYTCPTCRKLSGVKLVDYYTLEQLQEKVSDHVKILEWIDDKNIRCSCINCDHVWDKHYLWAVKNKAVCPVCLANSFKKWNVETVNEHLKKDGRAEFIEAIEWPTSVDYKATLRCKQCSHTWQSIGTEVIKTGCYCPKCSITGASKVQIKALTHIENLLGVKFDYYSGSGKIGSRSGEYMFLNPKSHISKLRADGYCSELNLMFEFHGDACHGNPEVYWPQDRPNKYTRLTAQELYNRTILREEYIKSLGYKLITWWEKDFYSEKPFAYHRDITIGNAFVHIRKEMDLETLKATLITEGRVSKVAGLSEIYWKYPSLDRDSGFARLSDELFSIQIIEHTPYYCIFECEGDQYITRSL